MKKFGLLRKIRNYFNKEKPPENSIKEQTKKLSVATVGLYFPESKTCMIRNPNVEESCLVFNIDLESNITRPVVGKWALGNDMSIALYDVERSIFFFKETFDDGAITGAIPFGEAGKNLLPVVGDWDGDGVSGLGLYNPVKRTFFLKNHLGSGISDHIFGFGQPNQGLIPLSGDWEGKGVETIGLYDPVTQEFKLKNTLSGGKADIKIKVNYSCDSALPITGDWNSNGSTSIGLYDVGKGLFVLVENLESPQNLKVFGFGPVGQVCIPFGINWHSNMERNVL